MGVLITKKNNDNKKNNVINTVRACTLLCARAKIHHLLDLETKTKQGASPYSVNVIVFFVIVPSLKQRTEMLSEYLILSNPLQKYP